MDLKKGLIGFGIGFSASVLIYEMLKKKNLSSRELTDRMIQATPGDGKITGTWLASIPETDPTICEETFYRGGVTALKNHETLRYEFLLNPENGEILQVEQIF